MTQTRQIVVPGEVIGSTDEHLPGQNTYQEGNEIRALRLGVKTVRGDRLSVIGLSGRYEPGRGDMVIGTVAELGPSNWYIQIGAANDVGMHVNDVPWRVEFGETSKYLDIGDTVLLKIVHVDEMKKAQVSMKDRQCRKLTGGLILEVSPTKVPRIVGRNGSMIQLLKDYTNVRIFVGQNGKIWVDGEADDVRLALEALRKIEDEAHTTGLTDRMKEWLRERRPEPVRRAEPEEEGEEAEEAFRPRQERRPRPKVVREEEDEAEERPQERPRHREERGERRGGRDRDRGERRRFDDERPRREERPRRFDDEERPQRRREESEERPRRRASDEDERPARRRDEDEERPRRRVADEQERPQRRRASDEDEERPRRRFAEEREERRAPPRREAEERPRLARRFDDEEEEERPVRRYLRDDDEESPRRESRESASDDGSGAKRRRRGGRGRGGRGRSED